MNGFDEEAFNRFYGEEIKVSQIEWRKLLALTEAVAIDSRDLIDLSYEDWRQWRIEHKRLCDERWEAEHAEKAA